MTLLNIHGDGKVIVGQRTKIADSVQIIFNEPSEIIIGDYCVIGENVKIICNGGNVLIDDWTTIHDGSLLLSTEGLTIGQHCWFGQYTVLDGTGGLYIGNNVRVGMYSQIWTHVAAGEQIEGCVLYGTNKVHINDSVWLVGSCTVSSGVTIGEKTIALNGSNITKSFESNIVIAGSPAIKKETLNFYKSVTLDDKWKMLTEWLVDFVKKYDVSLQISDDMITLQKNNDIVLFVKEYEKFHDNMANHTVCFVSNKTYKKCLSNLEYLVLKYLSGNKARFFKVGG